MAWYDEAVFYHIYPLGLCGAPKKNDYGEPVHRLNSLIPWIDHLKEIGVNALYIGPLFESVGHGYETTDYKKLDSRLGTNEDLKNFVSSCHDAGIRVIFDGVFNHTGRDFFAFQDIKKNRENSQYRDWYCNVNFGGNNEFGDGFSYENWGGYDLLAKLNQRNPAVKDYILDVVRFWVSEFDVDGIRLDAADVMDFDYMKALRSFANTVKSDFWLMGEVIHGDYGRWVNEGTLHSVTNYMLHKALYSGHNDHNYFEIAHTINYVGGMIGNTQDFRLYNFVDNHDVERIYTKLTNKAHFAPVHVLLFTLPGIPSIYYGSEFGIEGKKEQFSDDSLRPALDINDYKDAVKSNPCTALIKRLSEVKHKYKALSYGGYKQLVLTNRQFAYVREMGEDSVFVAVNNDDAPANVSIGTGGGEFIGLLSGKSYSGNNINLSLDANSGDILVKAGTENKKIEPVSEIKKAAAPAASEISGNTGALGNAGVSGAKAEAAMAKEKPDVDDSPIVTLSETVGIGKSKDYLEITENLMEKAEKMKVSLADKAASEYVDISKTTGVSYESMTVEQLQEAVLSKMARNGPVTDQMKKSVLDNVYHDSLVNWAKSF